MLWEIYVACAKVSLCQTDPAMKNTLKIRHVHVHAVNKN
jgi:hypothetical protein